MLLRDDYFLIIGELIDANFGQEPYVFDIEGEMKECQLRIHRTVENFPPPGKHGDWELLLHKMVSSYLVHQGFSATAEAFSKSTSTAGDIEEDFDSIRNRQHIQKLVLAGRMGEAIAMIKRLYPTFLQKNPSLHFMLKVRQFIEMVGGHDDLDHVANGADQEASPATDDTVSAKEASEQMEVDQQPINGNNIQNGDNSVTNNPVKFGKLIQFGRQLQTMLTEMEKNGVSAKQMDRNRKMQQEAFALVAYPNPWDSPVGWQLKPCEREIVGNALNSAIIGGSFGRPGRPPLEVALMHTKQLVNLMANNDLGACAFANVDDFVN